MTVSVFGRRFPAVATYVVSLASALLLLVLAIGTALWQSSAAEALNRDVRSSLERRSHYRVFLQHLTDAETGQRGFLITRQPAYLEPYNETAALIAGELRELEAIAAGNPAREAEFHRLQELTGRKLDELQLTIGLVQRGQPNLARGVVEADSGRVIMEEIRAIVDRALASENDRLEAALAAADAAGARLRWVMLLAGVLIVGIGVLLVVTVRNAMGELRASRDEARAASEHLSREMSARTQAEDKVRQMQKMEAIGQLTGGVAHDFNNMLAVIMSALQLAQRRMERGDQGVGTFIEAALDGARRAAALTSRLLAFARRTPLTPAVIDVNRTLGDMSDLLRRTLGEQIALETVLAGGLWRVHADRHELEQAILNVCVNARDAMPNGGKLTIESANAFLDDDYAAANVDVTAGQYVLIAITDTGDGMSPEVRRQAFEPFFTTKEVGKGTGLGLSHVHGFLKQSGGHVAIYSEIGVGTTLKLYLPRTNLTDMAEPAVRESVTPTGDAGTIILVVEDEERVRILSVAALRDLGYTVLHAANGATALETLQKNPGIALLFTDVVMPGMSGRVLSEEARKVSPALKVLYTTGYTKNAIVHNGVVDADARLLLKPYSLSELGRKVRAVLDE
ncbi:MAG: CHASE3 domain-containing protein [Hyphomonadaceae bacterium]